MNNINKSKLIKYIGTILSLVLFIYLLSRQDWNSVIILMNELNLSFVLIVYLLYSASIITNGFRWHALLRNAEVNFSLADSIKTTYIGGFLSNFLPSTIGGDSFRFLYLLRYEEKKEICLASLVFDRILNLFVMGSILPFAFVRFYPEIPNVLSKLRLTMGKSINPYLRYGGIGILGEFWAKLSLILRKFLSNYKFFFYSGESIVKPFCYAIVSIVFSTSGTYIMATQLAIIISPLDVIAIASLIYIFTLIPISFNGLGVRELIMTTLYISLGATIEQATTLSIITRILMVFVTSIGFIWFGQIMSSIKLSNLIE